MPGKSPSAATMIFSAMRTPHLRAEGRSICKLLANLVAGLNRRGLCAPPTRNAETVKNYPRGVGAIERVKVNACDVVVQKIVTLFQGEVDADASDHFRIVFASLKSAQKLGREARALGQLGDAVESVHGGNRHDARDNGDMNVGERTTFAEIEKVAIIEK
jgi:hypothetical protein